MFDKTRVISIDCIFTLVKAVQHAAELTRCKNVRFMMKIKAEINNSMWVFAVCLCDFNRLLA